VICHCTKYGLEKEHLAPVCSRYIKKGPLPFTHAVEKFYSLKAIQIFLFVWKFHIVNCLKLFDFTSFFVYTLKWLKGHLWHIFLLYFEKHMTCFRAWGSRVVYQLLNKIMQKLSAKVSKRGPSTSLKKWGPETTALFAFPNIHPYSQLHTKERTGFIL